jgi:hypothetical protein
MISLLASSSDLGPKIKFHQIFQSKGNNSRSERIGLFTCPAIATEYSPEAKTRGCAAALRGTMSLCGYTPKACKRRTKKGSIRHKVVRLCVFFLFYDRIAYAARCAQRPNHLEKQNKSEAVDYSGGETSWKNLAHEKFWKKPLR